MGTVKASTLQRAQQRQGREGSDRERWGEHGLCRFGVTGYINTDCKPFLQRASVGSWGQR